MFGKRKDCKDLQTDLIGVAPTLLRDLLAMIKNDSLRRLMTALVDAVLAFVGKNPPKANKTPSGKRAVCFGINDYEGTRNDLGGCVNDAKAWASLLAEHGYDVGVILDSEVTKKRFLSTLLNLVLSASTGDKMIITYSGHGSSVPDDSGDETDGRDETLYSYDGNISDDEIGDVVKLLPPGVELTLVFDSCHSGTATRGLKKQAPVVVKPSGEIKEVLFAGCKDEESSFDSTFDGVPQGAFTHYAVQELRANPELCNWGLYEAVGSHLPSRLYPQTPCVYGAKANLEKRFL